MIRNLRTVLESSNPGLACWSWYWSVRPAWYAWTPPTAADAARVHRSHPPTDAVPCRRNGPWPRGPTKNRGHVVAKSAGRTGEITRDMTWNYYFRFTILHSESWNTRAPVKILYISVITIIMDIGYRFWAAICLSGVLCQLSLLKGALSLYSVSCTSLTKCFCNTTTVVFNHFDPDSYVQIRSCA